MSELESAEALALAIDTGCWLEGAVPLILADRNAVRVALIAEIESLAKSNDARNEDFASQGAETVTHLEARAPGATLCGRNITRPGRRYLPPSLRAVYVEAIVASVDARNLCPTCKRVWTDRARREMGSWLQT